jgi:hypothetical protein
VLPLPAHLLFVGLFASPGAGTGGSAGTHPISAPPGRTVTVVATEDVGAPLERAFPSAAYARAAAADAELRWDDARLLYRQAAEEWTTSARTRPSRALENAIAKAEHEAVASQALAGYERLGAPSLDHLPVEARRAFQRRRALEVGRILRAKLTATRAALGRTPPELYGRARDRLEEARDAGPPTPDGGDAETELLLCATYAVGGDATAARLARAHVPSAARADPANALARGACAAALGETDAALAALESFVLRPLIPRAEATLRDVYLANDWDHLRGDPRFETLFR